jgi:hypothetical protein
LGMTQEEMKEAFHALTEEEREEFKWERTSQNP